MPRSLGHLQSDLKYALTTAGDLIWPKRSILSGEPSRGSLTPEDFKSLSFITGSICRQCGVPQDLDLGETAICAACHARKPAWSRARAALIYDDVSRKPVLALKRGGQRAGLELMANWMSIAGADLIEDADIILPVPLHYSRLISRGYNQAGWLAAAVSRRTGKPLRHAALKRIKATPSQAGRSANQRRANLRGAFAVRKSHHKAIQDRRILLIDDVLTTGATVNAAAKVLRRAGARDVSVLVLARVVRDENVAI